MDGLGWVEYSVLAVFGKLGVAPVIEYDHLLRTLLDSTIFHEQGATRTETWTRLLFLEVLAGSELEESPQRVVLLLAVEIGDPVWSFDFWLA